MLTTSGTKKQRGEGVRQAVAPETDLVVRVGEDCTAKGGGFSRGGDISDHRLLGLDPRVQEN